MPGAAALGDHHAAAEAHYHAVGEWLAAKGSPLYAVAPVIYPQDSFRIGTTTYPIGANEHDLDFVCEINIDWNRTPALDVLNAVEERLRAHGTYAPMVERLKRCIRLNYAGAFHMDILPAAPETVRYGTEGGWLRTRCLKRSTLNVDFACPRENAAWPHAGGQNCVKSGRNCEEDT